jgi:hypothetical protein
MSSGESVCGITFLLRLCGRHVSWKNVVITISHRELFALANTSTGTGHTMSRYDEEDGNDGGGEGEQGQEGRTGVGEMEEAEMDRWFHGRNGVLAQRHASSRHLHSTGSLLKMTGS